MSLHAFDTLRAKHPAQGDVVTSLEDVLAQTINRDPHAVLDELVIDAQLRSRPQAREALRQDPDLPKQLLVELAAMELLRPVFFWMCESGMGPSMEASSVAEFPFALDCDRCGGRHEFAPANIEVQFIATNLFIDRLSSSETR